MHARETFSLVARARFGGPAWDGVNASASSARAVRPACRARARKLAMAELIFVNERAEVETSKSATVRAFILS